MPLSNYPITLGRIKHEVQRFEDHIYGIALKLVESRARKLLAAHPNLDEFVMGMGGWMFTRKGIDNHDNISLVFRDRIPHYASSFTRLMGEFDILQLKITGEPMRFTSDGPVVRSWGTTERTSSRRSPKAENGNFNNSLILEKGEKRQ